MPAPPPPKVCQEEYPGQWGDHTGCSGYLRPPGPSSVSFLSWTSFCAGDQYGHWAFARVGWGQKFRDLRAISDTPSYHELLHFLKIPEENLRPDLSL